VGLINNKIKEPIMKKLSGSQLTELTGGKDDPGCSLYLLETGLVAMVGGMAFGPVGVGLVAGFLFSVPNPCNS
jgi:hypothetical protein